MQPLHRTITEPFEVRSRLAELGLNEDICRHAVEEATAAYNSCTPHHPRTHAGNRAWADAVKSLRDSLVQQEWRAEDDNNLPFVVNKGGTVAIMVATADKSTRRKNETPCTNSSKGPRTKNAIVVNEAQLLLIPDVHLMPEQLEKHKKMGRMTFMLLMHRDAQAQEVRCELSRPIRVEEDGRVKGWIERIIVSPLPFLGPTVDIVPDVPQSPEIDVKVKRRA